MKPDDFEFIDEYYEAREREINISLILGKKLDYEDLDYIDNNYQFITEKIFAFVDEYGKIRFFEYIPNHQPREVKIKNLITYSWEYVN